MVTCRSGKVILPKWRRARRRAASAWLVPRAATISSAHRTPSSTVEHLRASHCKPWRDSTDSERLDGENGLLLTPTIDHLVDRGFISFEADGRLLVSPVAHRASLERMGVPVGERLNVGAFSEGQRRYVEFHQERVFLEARVKT